ncbi:HAD-IA family hydrolase [bacterium]|nr:HAD-IA family hydrolase [bacterium]
MSSERKLDAVFFDVAMTLIHPYPGVGAVYGDVARQFGIDVPSDVLDRTFMQAWAETRKKAVGSPYGKTEMQGKLFWRAVVAQTFALAGARMPADPYFQIVYDAFASPDCWRVFDDVEPALERVHGVGAKTGIISNFDTRLDGLLDGLGLAKYFDYLTVSCHVGVEKPDPAIFDAARMKTELPAERLGFVGDQPSDDGAGATAAGWNVCLVDRKGRLGDCGYPTRPDLVAAVEHLLS